MGNSLQTAINSPTVGGQTDLHLYFACWPDKVVDKLQLIFINNNIFTFNKNFT